MLKFDWTINFPLIISLGVGVIGLFNIWLKQRDFNREILTLLGKRAPRDERHGLLGDVADLKELSEVQMDMIEAHQIILVPDRRHQVRRRDAGEQ
jgi:hypothetical protein